MNLPGRLRLCPLVLTALVVLGLFSIVLRADDPASAPVTDPVRVGDSYRQMLARPQFQETGETGFNPRLEDWLSQWFKRLGAKIGDFKYASQMHTFESLLMTLLVVFSIAVLFYIMVRLTRRRGGMDAEPSLDHPGAPVSHAPEQYDAEIEQAIRSGDWHTAWLASWRQFLSRLERHHLVEADRTRTNREYLAQLRGKSLPASALALLNGMVDAYDRFIYGRTSIGESEWNQFYRQIDEAALLLHLDDKRSGAPAKEGAA